MMPVRNADAVWNGNLQEGNGTMRLGSGMFEGPYSFKSRMQDGEGTNPEELIAAAHAGCFSMAISRIELSTEGEVPGFDEAAFVEHANSAKETCPVSKALAAVEITLEAKLA